MLIKVINVARRSPRTRGDLRRLFKYLFEPKALEDSADDRLLGPPELHHLITNFRPWGAESYEAAHELALQMEDYCKLSTVGRELPENWFAHLIFSFAPWTSDNLRSPADDFKSPKRHMSQAKNATRIAKDALDFLGWSDEFPSLFVTHGDRDHVHVHAVFPTVGHDGRSWPITNPDEYDEQVFMETAKICAETFQLSLSTAKLKAYYKRWGSLSSGNDV